MGGPTEAMTISSAGALVVLLDAPAPVADAVLASVVGADPFGDILNALTTHGVRGLPALALVAVDGDGLRVLVRGDLQVEVVQRDGQRAVADGRGVSTWAESLHPSAARAVVVHASGRAVFATAPSEAIASASGVAVAPVTPSVLEPPPQQQPAALLEPGHPASTGQETIVPVAPATNDEPLAAIDAAAGEELEPEFDFANLFETRCQGLEAAAVRDTTGDDAEPLGAGATTPPAAATVPVAAPPPEASSAPAAPAARLISGLPGFGDASVAPPARAPAPPGDHDGLTITAAELTKLRAGAGPAGAATTAAVPDPSMVPAVACPVGHMNAPRAERCRTCGQPIADRSITIVKRPVLGRLLFDTGMVVDVDRPLVVGRKPTLEMGTAIAEVPALVTLPDPESSLSRVHAEVRLDGWEVLVVDRGSTNGTYVELPGQPKRMLRPNEPLVVVADTRISFADVTSCTFSVGAP